MVLFQVVLPLLAPVALVAAVAAAAAGRLGPALIAAGVLLATECLHACAAGALARRSGGSSVGAARTLFWLVAGRLLYRPLLFAVGVRSLARVLDGIPLGWNKLARRGTVRPEAPPVGARARAAVG
jgi:hypothetical protein